MVLAGGSILHLSVCWLLVCVSRYNCNRFNEKESKDARDLQAVSWLVYLSIRKCGFGSVLQTSRAALERYLFYCNRYMNHMKSLQMEHKVNLHVALPH